jgi:hypothetical protein
MQSGRNENTVSEENEVEGIKREEKVETPRMAGEEAESKERCWL